jgi:hypothetical protein
MTIGETCAILIAALALGFSIWDRYKSRKHELLTLKPTISELRMKWPERGIWQYRILNAGLGPAIVTSMRIYREGQLVQPEEGVPPMEQIAKYYTQGYEASSVACDLAGALWIPSNSERSLLELQFTDDKRPSEQEIMDKSSHLAIVIHYESIFGEKFLFDPANIEKKR